MKLDLHGYQVHEAWRTFKQATDEAYFDGLKSFVVITGQGTMMQEFPVWAHTHSRVKEINQHKHNAGSFTVKLKKK